MIMQTIRKRLNQKGFTLVELMVVIAILGVLAAIAIPKFSESTAAANTAKIQADLRTLDSAIVMAQAAGKTPTKAEIGTQLDDYVATVPTPPSGKCYMKGVSSIDVPATTYTIDTANLRALCGGTNTSEKFGKSAS